MSGSSFQACGRTFGEVELEVVRRAIDEAEPALRAEIARRVCRELDWTDALGRPKLMSCRVALLRLHRAGWIELPAPRNGNGNTGGLVRQRVEWPEEEPIEGSVGALGALELEVVQGKKRSALWNGLMERYHYLGYQPLAGAQLRYLVRSAAGLLGALGFGAAAWKVAARDEWIGWDAATRERELGRVLNNARFLVFPWARVKNLASRVLSLASRAVVRDFEQAYGVRPVLLETFVEQGRFRGTCYRAANWLHVGETRGRGKADRDHRARLPVKDVYLYALVRNVRCALGVSS